MDTARKKKAETSLSWGIVWAAEMQKRTWPGLITGKCLHIFEKEPQKKTSILLKPETCLKVPKLPKIPKFCDFNGQTSTWWETLLNTELMSPQSQCPNPVLGLLTRSYKMGTAGLPTCKKGLNQLKISKETPGCRWFQNNTWRVRGHRCLSDVPIRSWCFFPGGQRWLPLEWNLTQTLMKSKIQNSQIWVLNAQNWRTMVLSEKCWQYQGLSSFDKFEYVWGTDYHHRNATF